MVIELTRMNFLAKVIRIT